MSKKTKQPTYYFRMDESLIKRLDKRIDRAGYQSRSEFFTAVAYVALYSENKENQTKNPAVEKLPETVTTWIQKTMSRASEEEILSGLHGVIEEILYPVIAMKGVDVAYENTWEDVRGAFHAKSGVWVTESDLRDAYASFATIHRAELMEYRERQIMGREFGE